MHRKFSYSIIFLFLLALLSACGKTQNLKSGDQPKIDQSVFTASYPYPVTTPSSNYFETAYPPEQNQQSSPSYINSITIPTPNKTTGIVIGQLIIESENEKPYLAPSLYLGSALDPSNPKYPPLISLNIEGDPKAIQDKTGKFVFTDIKEGKYGLIIWSPYTQTVISDPKNQQNPLVFNVSSGEIIDLGKISVP